MGLDCCGYEIFWNIHAKVIQYMNVVFALKRWQRYNIWREDENKLRKTIQGARKGPNLYYVLMELSR